MFLLEGGRSDEIHLCFLLPLCTVAIYSLKKEEVEDETKSESRRNSYKLYQPMSHGYLSRIESLRSRPKTGCGNLIIKVKEWPDVELVR